MNPRRENSKRWVTLPGELSDQITEVFKAQFAADEKATFSCRGRIYKQEILLQVGRHEPGRLAQANFDISLNYDVNKENVLQLVLKAVDLAGALMSTYLEDEEADFPRTWEPQTVEGKELFFRFHTENSQLEDEANRLLGIESEGGLVGGAEEDDDESLKLTLEKLGLSEDDLPDPSERH